MKKLVLSISMFLIAATTFAQSEVVTDSIPPISLDGYKNFNGFMLDMGSMIMAPPPLIAPQLYYQPYNNNAIANYNEIFRPNMNIIYDRGSYNHVFTPCIREWESMDSEQCQCLPPYKVQPLN